MRVAGVLVLARVEEAFFLGRRFPFLPPNMAPKTSSSMRAVRNSMFSPGYLCGLLLPVCQRLNKIRKVGHRLIRKHLGSVGLPDRLNQLLNFVGFVLCVPGVVNLSVLGFHVFAAVFRDG